MGQTVRTGVLLVAAVAAGYVGGLMGQSTRPAAAQGPNTVRDVVTARSFVLVDGQGRVRGTFDTARDGDPTLGLRDRGGRERVAVQVLKDGAPKMSLMDAGGRWTNYECK